MHTSRSFVVRWSTTLSLLFVCLSVWDASPPKLLNGFKILHSGRGLSVSNFSGDRPSPRVLPGEPKMWFSWVDSHYLLCHSSDGASSLATRALGVKTFVLYSLARWQRHCISYHRRDIVRDLFTPLGGCTPPVV